MAVRVGINGFGRIGRTYRRAALRHVQERDGGRRGHDRRTDGVVDVVGNLAYRLDDARLRTEERTQTMHGVADDWLRRL